LVVGFFASSSVYGEAVWGVIVLLEVCCSALTPPPLL
jgi:hypothetical protein